VETVSSGSVLTFECRDATNGQLAPDATADDVLDIDGDPIHPLTGPIAVESASPEDVLEVEILDIEHHGVGYTYFYPDTADKGLVPDEFSEPGLHIRELSDGVAHFVDDITVPLDPFPGNLGVAPADHGSHSTTPPRRVGGNLDIKHLTEGARLYLPIEIAGGLFSIGDCHAAQGDGEVCVTGIEAPMDVTVRLTLHTDQSITTPQFETFGPFTPTGSDEPMHATTGIGNNLYQAAQQALREMIDLIHTQYGLTRKEAYLLSSAAVDLKLSEVVNDPNWVVSAYLPKNIF